MESLGVLQVDQNENEKYTVGKSKNRTKYRGIPGIAKIVHIIDILAHIRSTKLIITKYKMNRPLLALIIILNVMRPLRDFI